MARNPIELTQAQRKVLGKARVMRAKGASWRVIGNALGVRPGWVRYRLDRVYNVRCAERRVSGSGEKREMPLSSDELMRRLALIPPDTRDLTARICGDPIPNDPRRQLCES